MDAPAQLVGRDRELQRGLDTIGKGLNLLIVGPDGIGKRTLLRALRARLEASRPCLWVGAGTAKGQAFALARQTHESIGLRVPRALIPRRHLARAEHEGVRWGWVERGLQRMPAQACLDLVLHTLRGAPVRPLVFLERLALPTGRAGHVIPLLETCQVVACLGEEVRCEPLRRLLWRFPDRERISLAPLTPAACRELIEHWLAAHPLRFHSESVRTGFVEGLVQDSGGSPLAIVRMLETAAAESEIDADNLRDFAQEAGLRYIDMTPSVILLLAGAVLARFIARGTGSTELYVLAGVGLAAGIVLRFFLWPMMQRRAR